MKSKVLKRLIVLVLAVVMVVGGAVNVYAANYVVKEDGVQSDTENMSDADIFSYMKEIFYSNANYEEFNYELMGCHDGVYRIYFSNSPFYSKYNSNYKYTAINAQEEYHSIYMGASKDDLYIFTHGTGEIYTSLDYVVYSNFDMYDNDGNLSLAKLSFPIPPVVLGVKTEQLTQMILPTMSPVVGLISLVVCSVVLLIGLKKGLSLLWTALRKA